MEPWAWRERVKLGLIHKMQAHQRYCLTPVKESPRIQQCSTSYFQEKPDKHVILQAKIDGTLIFVEVKSN